MRQQIDFGKQDHWLKLVQRWQRSGLSVRDFCARDQLSELSFYSWRRVLRLRGLLDHQPTNADNPAFVKVTVAAEPTPSLVEVVLGNRVLRVRPGFGADMLLELVRLLEELAC